MEAIEKIAKDVLNELKKDYPAFLIESHFQYEFALVLAKQGMDVHLERYAKPGNIQKNITPIGDKDYWRVDLEAQYEKEIYMFEFKYLTAQVDVEMPNKNITLHLKQQSGAKKRKIDIWRDIEKLEFLKDNKKCTQACFVMLANDWGTINSRSRGINSVLDIYPGKKYSDGPFNYTVTTRQGKAVISQIQINKPYSFDYADYSQVNTPNIKTANSIFKSLILPIK